MCRILTFSAFRCTKVKIILFFIHRFSNSLGFKYNFCTSGVCYFSKAAGPNQEHRRCATERVEAVTSLDILYNRFHKISMKTMEASDGVKSCGSVYDCPDGEPGCQTRLEMSHWIFALSLYILIRLFTEMTILL